MNRHQRISGHSSSAPVDRSSRLLILTMVAALLASVAPMRAQAVAPVGAFPPPSGPKGSVTSKPNGAPLLANPAQPDPGTGLTSGAVFQGETGPAPGVVATPDPSQMISLAPNGPAGITTNPAFHAPLLSPGQAVAPQFPGGSVSTSSQVLSPAKARNSVQPLSAIPSTTNCTWNMLRDSSFESADTLQYWEAQDAPGAVTESQVGSGGREGAGELQTSSSVSGGSVAQILNYTSSNQDSYQGTVWVRADSAQPGPVTGSLWLGAWGVNNPLDGAQTNFSIGTTWTPVTVQLMISSAGQSYVGLKLIMNNVNVTYDWDAAQLVNGGMINGSFEDSSNFGWSSSSTSVTTANYGNSNVFDGARYAAFQTSVGANGLMQSISATIPTKTNYEYSTWVRSEDGNPISGYVALFADGGAYNENSATGFTVSGAWTLIQASVDTTTSHTVFYPEVFLSTTGRTLDVDSNTLVNACLVDAGFNTTTPPTGTGTTSRPA